MANAVQTAPVTYQAKLEQAQRVYLKYIPNFINLTQLIQTATDPKEGGYPFITLKSKSQIYIDDGSFDLLSHLLNKSYKHYDAVLREHKIAKTALQQLSEIYEECSAGKVELTPEQVQHLTNLGIMGIYHRQETNRAESCTKLAGVIFHLNLLIKNTHIFIKKTEEIGNKAAYALMRMSGKTTIYDMIPARNYFYFEQGFTTYLAQQSTVTSE